MRLPLLLQAVKLKLPRNLIDPDNKNDFREDFIRSFGYSMSRAEIASGGVQIEVDAHRLARAAPGLFGSRRPVLGRGRVR
jgi:hypothetical protein